MLTLAHDGPRVIEIGKTVSLTASLRDETDTVPTVTAAAYTLRDGSAALVDAAAATSLGPPVAYSLAGSVTSSLSPSERILEEWSVTVGGVVTTLRRGGYLVRCAFTPTLTDDDLLSAHRDIRAHLDPEETSFERYREAARTRIERELVKKGRRPWLIFDSWALFDAHLALTLHLVFQDSRSSLGPGEYRELAGEYLARFEREMATEAVFRYDSGDTGRIDEPTQRAAAPVVMMGAGPGARWGQYRRAL